MRQLQVETAAIASRQIWFTVRFVQTADCQLEMPSTVPRIGPCGERTVPPPRPCVDDYDDEDGRQYQV